MSLLSECYYALGEAIVNTDCAMRMEKRDDIRKQFEEDYMYFSDLRKRIESEMQKNRDKKKGIDV